MRILITGANGFVGGYLIAHLREAHPDVHVTALVHGPVNADLGPDIAQVHADLTAGAGEEFRQVVRDVRPDHVYHLAGAASGAGQDREAIFRVNVEGTRVVMTALTEEAPLARVLFTSTGYVYGDCDPARPAQEEDALAPVGLYAESKQAAEPYARAAGAIIVRSFNHTGPGQTPAFAVPAFAAQIAAIEKGVQPPELRVGNLDALRDFLDVRDVVRAYHALLTRAEPGIYNVCRGKTRSMQSILDELVSLSVVPLSVTNDPARMRPADIAVSVGSPDKLRHATGWTPHIPLSQTLVETLDWWRSQKP